MKDDEKYQELFNALLIKYGIEPDEDWTNIEWKILIDSKLDTKQRDLFYNELVNLDLNYKGWTRHSTKGPTQEEIEQNKSAYSRNSKQYNTGPTYSHCLPKDKICNKIKKFVIDENNCFD